MMQSHAPVPPLSPLKERKGSELPLSSNGRNIKKLTG